jgi:hypothetical protein
MSMDGRYAAMQDAMSGICPLMKRVWVLCEIPSHKTFSHIHVVWMDGMQAFAVTAAVFNSSAVFLGTKAEPCAKLQTPHRRIEANR